MQVLKDCGANKNEPDPLFAGTCSLAEENHQDTDTRGSGRLRDIHTNRAGPGQEREGPSGLY